MAFLLNISATLEEDSTVLRFIDATNYTPARSNYMVYFDVFKMTSKGERIETSITPDDVDPFVVGTWDISFDKEGWYQSPVVAFRNFEDEAGDPTIYENNDCIHIPNAGGDNVVLQLVDEVNYDIFLQALPALTPITHQNLLDNGWEAVNEPLELAYTQGEINEPSNIGIAIYNNIFIPSLLRCRNKLTVQAAETIWTGDDKETEVRAFEAAQVFASAIQVHIVLQQFQKGESVVNKLRKLCGSC